MSPSSKVLLLLIFILYQPLLYFNGSQLILFEIYGYLYIAYLILSRKQVLRSRNQKIFLFYLVSMIIIEIASTLLNATLKLSNTYNLRKIIQLIIFFGIFYSILYKNKELLINDKFVLKIVIILVSPIVFTYLQTYNPQIKLMTYDYFKPSYYYSPSVFFKGSTFENASQWMFRSTSVFKDFFTATNYFILVSIFLIYLINSQKKYRWLYITFLILTVIGQIFTARTGLLFIPIGIIFYFIIKQLVNKTFSIKSILVLLLLVVFLVMFYALLYNIVQSNPQLSWANQFFYLFQGDNAIEQFSSIQSTSMNNSYFLRIVERDPSILYFPHHVYGSGIKYHSVIYTTDSFYLQELYRYAIYGIIAFLILTYKLLKYNRKNYVIITMIVILVLTNVKGGNTFFLDKTVVIFAFLLAFLELRFYVQKKV